MHVGDKVSYDAVNEAYCLLTSYIREEGKIGAKYDPEHLKSFVVFLASILKHPENFVEVEEAEQECTVE
jgi:hypothetical protein